MNWPWSKKQNESNGKAARQGLWGEKIAGHYLREKGFKILGSRIRLGRRDELDLAVQDKNTLVFVEVKTRKSEAFGRPVSSVDRGKQYALSRAAIRYLKKLKSKPAYFRFDVIEVIGEEGAADPIVRHIENAFPLSAPFRVTW